MRVLLDTNIIIHREANNPQRQEIGILFRWLDRLQYEKCIHPETIKEIRRYKDKSVVTAFETKIASYHELKTLAPDNDAITAIRSKYDKSDNDRTDTDILNEVLCRRVELLITEDRKIHKKAVALQIAERVFTIDAFLEKVTAEYPALADYKVLAVKKEYFGNLDLTDQFFDSFREDYIEFDNWFNRKSDEVAYICISDNNEIVAFLYVKTEDKNENIGNIIPIFSPKKRLKIGTFKVISNGYKLGERFLKIVFDNALRFSVDEIYVTLFDRTLQQNRLIQLLSDWGFMKHGVKKTDDGEEIVLSRNFRPHIDTKNPCNSYPYISDNSRKFLVPIYPDYHTELFPDSILRTESPNDFTENKPNRNAISKVYISRSIERDLNTGDVVVFYRTASGGSAYHTSVTTTIGVVQTVTNSIKSEEHFLELCRKRSVFSDNELRKYWNHNPKYRPFVVNFLYVYSLPKRMNLEALINAGVVQSTEDAPRGFLQISNDKFYSILVGSNADQRFIVNQT
jgi:predicted nucleic acid-binding protein